MALVLKESDWQGTLKEASAQHYKLIIIVGLPGAGKTAILQDIIKDYDVSTINMGEELSRALMATPLGLRPIKAEDTAEKLILDAPTHQIAIDNIEILFESPMELNPLSFIKRISQSKTIIVTWTGNYSNNTLTYGTPDHPASQEFPLTAQDTFHIIDTTDFS
jgi:hypothetical protein